jgi:hypothetical protein
MSERADDLAQMCTDLLRKGLSFPNIWATMLKHHTLVTGVAHQKLEGARSLLDIWLVTRERLVFDLDAKQCSVDWVRGDQRLLVMRSQGTDGTVEPMADHR